MSDNKPMTNLARIIFLSAGSRSQLAQRPCLSNPGREQYYIDCEVLNPAIGGGYRLTCTEAGKVEVGLRLPCPFELCLL